ncbi:protease inhibitor I9 family protein [Streptomyces sp. NPDC048383]|uniref:protease inhibitor I9 family protein n=1 Tax=Streptomyces sp. NPDC048383 TaxID=3155386 RepID=UPI0034245198
MRSIPGVGLRRPILRPVLVAAAVLVVPLAGVPVAYAAQVVESVRPGDEARTEPYIVTLAPDADPQRVMDETGVTKARYVYRSTVRGFAADLDAAQLAALRAHPAVVGVERDGRAVGAPVEGDAATGDW